MNIGLMGGAYARAAAGASVPDRWRAAAGAAHAGAPMQALRVLLARVEAAWQVRRTRAALARLSERELADIGLSRSDLDRLG